VRENHAACPKIITAATRAGECAGNEGSLRMTNHATGANPIAGSAPSMRAPARPLPD